MARGRTGLRTGKMFALDHGDLLTSIYFLGSPIIGIYYILFSKNHFILDLRSVQFFRTRLACSRVAENLPACFATSVPPYCICVGDHAFPG